MIHFSWSSEYILITFAGIPTAIELAGIFFVTTEFEPIILPFPIDTPLVITTLEPIHTFFSIIINEVEINLLTGISEGCDWLNPD